MLSSTAGKQCSRVHYISAFFVLPAMAIFMSHGCRPAEKAPPPTSPEAPSVSQPWFVESAQVMQVGFRQRAFKVQRFQFPEVMPGGVCMIDYDNDGDLDLYFVQSGDLIETDRPGNELYRNNGDGTFTNVTQSAGVADRGYGMGCTCGDYDNDGVTDLFVTNFGPNILYRNNGNGTFSDVTKPAGVAGEWWGASCAFVDYDRDGDLDLLVTNYVNWSVDRELECRTSDNNRDYCSPLNYNSPAPDELFRNNGDGSFTDVSEEAGLRNAFGNGLGIAVADFDSDGRLDLYVANDANPNQLWLHEDGDTFTDRALLHGCALSGMGAAEAGMGVMAVDADSDGDSDLFMSHIRKEANRFYLNSGGVFDDATAKTGLAAPSLAKTGFGLGFADFDHDGILDLYVANGRVTLHQPVEDRDHPFAEVNQLFQGQPGLHFEEVRPIGGTGTPLVEASRGAAFGDIDNDGAIDVVVVNFDGPVHVLRNVAGQRGAWVMLRVVNRHGSDALGASVRLQAGGRTQWRDVQVAYSYCASNDPRVHFGLGDASQVDSVLVKWPDGSQESFGPFSANELHTLQKGDGQAP